MDIHEFMQQIVDQAKDLEQQAKELKEFVILNNLKQDNEK